MCPGNFFRRRHKSKSRLPATGQELLNAKHIASWLTDADVFQEALSSLTDIEDKLKFWQRVITKLTTAHRLRSFLRTDGVQTALCELLKECIKKKDKWPDNIYIESILPYLALDTLCQAPQGKTTPILVDIAIGHLDTLVNQFESHEGFVDLLAALISHIDAYGELSKLFFDKHHYLSKKLIELLSNFNTNTEIQASLWMALMSCDKGRAFLMFHQDTIQFTKEIADELITMFSTSETPEVLLILLLTSANHTGVAKLLFDNESNISRVLQDFLVKNDLSQNIEVSLWIALVSTKKGKQFCLNHLNLLKERMSDLPFIAQNENKRSLFFYLINELRMDQFFHTTNRLQAVTQDFLYDEVAIDSKQKTRNVDILLKGNMVLTFRLIVAKDAHILSLLKKDEVNTLFDQCRNKEQLIDYFSVALNSIKSFFAIEQALYLAGRLDLFYEKAMQRALAIALIKSEQSLTASDVQRMMQYMQSTALNYQFERKTPVHILLQHQVGVEHLRKSEYFYRQLLPQTLGMKDQATDHTLQQLIDFSDKVGKSCLVFQNM